MKKIVLAIISIVAVMSMLVGCSALKDMKSGFETGFKKAAQGGITTTYNRGKWNGTTFESKQMGIKFNLADGWNLSSEEVIMGMNDGDYAGLSDEAKKNYDYAKLRKIYEFLLTGPDGMSSVYLWSENISQAGESDQYTEKQYLDVLQKQMSETQGARYNFGATTKATVAGKEFTVLPSVIADSAMQRIYARKEGKFITVIMLTFSSKDEAGLNAQVAAFEKL